jgi:hypothetical protein
VLRHDVWRAKAKDVGSLIARLASCRCASARRRKLGNQGGMVWCGGVDDVTTDRYPSAMTMKPVQQCARRGASALDVAQASPLFSDHAPREVHLWQ